MPTIFVFPQVTLADVLACAATLGLEVESLLRRAGPGLAERTGDPETDLVGCLLLPDERLARHGVDPVWRALAEKVKRGAVLSHPASSAWFELTNETRRASGLRTARVVRPVGVRTLLTRFEKPSWDFRAMPSDDLGSDGTDEGLSAALYDAIRPTTGGPEYLAPAPRERALAVLATTLAAVLSEEPAQKSDHRRAAKLVRPDVYERAVEGMGLGAYFQVIRRLFELDHPDHPGLRAAWPRPADPVRALGFLEYRGRRDPYLALNGPRLTKLA
jgi:hypothetical protein